ncbi:MAG: hypothetical protein LAO24_17755 [Acidobacteriia bacterium]|nr:hypothetical protein [Terriglobia bacterium]
MRYLALICLLFASYPKSAAADMKPDEVIAKHLDSIGTAEARAAVKSRAVQGTLRFKIVVGGGGETAGNWQLLSEQRKSRFVMKFGNDKWWGEQFVFDGDKASFSAATLSGKWSAFGGFVASQDSLVKEGLLGGELGTGWALQNIDRHRVKLDYIGLKKIDGRELQGIEYLSKANGAMTIKLYFEPDTHHHVMTVYAVARAPVIAANDVANATQHEVRYIIEERFSDFQTDSGITLPRKYDLRFSQELQNGTNSVYDWLMTADKIVENPNLDPANFQAK